MKEVIFVILEGFADWEGAYIATCLNQGVKPGNPISYKSENFINNQRTCKFNRWIQGAARLRAQRYAGKLCRFGINWRNELVLTSR